MKRATPLRRSNWRRNNPKRRRNPMATGWTQRVFALYGRKCFCGRRAVQAHHVVPRQRIVTAPHLSQEEREALEYDARNGLPICKECHEGHENAVRRIPHGALRHQHVVWAINNGFGMTVDDERLYPGRRAYG